MKEKTKTNKQTKNMSLKSQGNYANKGHANSVVYRVREHIFSLSSFILDSLAK